MKHQTQKPADYSAQFAPVHTGAIIMHANEEDGARPYVRLLELAGIPYTRTPNGGYSFTFEGRPDLTAETPARQDLATEDLPGELPPAGAALAELAPEMYALLRQMLTLYEGRRLFPPESYASYWTDVRRLLERAEGAAEENQTEV